MFSKCDQTIHSLLRGHSLDALCDFVRIPCKSSDFDPDWESNGLLKKACETAASWAQKLLPDAKFEVLTAPNKTPALFFDIPASSPSYTKSALIYGHLDKQPEAQGWTQGREPFVPSLEGEALYGRGAADDGYSFYSAITAVCALRTANIDHCRVVGLIETDEESGSGDMQFWLEQIQHRCGDVSLILVLDGTAADYERMWMTTSFRGCINLTLNVQVLSQAVHSGSASGIVPDSFRIARFLLERIEDSRTGEILLPELTHPIEEERLQQIKATSEILGETVLTEFPWHKKTHAAQDTVFDNLVTRGFKPQMCIVGAEGLPPISQAGRVIRTQTSLALSLRTPPQVDTENALKAISKTLTQDAPYGAEITITDSSAGNGWSAKVGCHWFDKALDISAREVFGQPVAQNCDGASIPTLSLLQSYFQDAQMLVTGVLGPGSNAHGPDEMLRLDYLDKLTGVIARLFTRVEK